MMKEICPRLIESAAQGDPRAVDELLALARPLVLSYCRSRLHNYLRSYVEDVAQEVMIGLLHAVARFDVREQSSFLRYLYGISSHKVNDFLRRAQRARTEPFALVPEQESGDITPECAALRRELREALSQMLAALPAAKRELLILRVVVGMSAEETATALGMSVGSVRVTQHRVLAALRQQLRSSSVLVHGVVAS